MKKKLSRLLLSILLAATVQIQPLTTISLTQIQATTVSETEETTTDTSTKDAVNPYGNKVKSQLDTTDGDTDVSWPQGPNANSLSSTSAILMDADTGLILYNKNMTEKHYPASITKIMTTLLAIENCKLDDVVTFTADEVLNLESGASNIGTQVGEKLTIDQCLYGIMLSSANEVCNGVADYVGGDTKNFAKMMTERANQLGAVCTQFTNANGLHSDDHFTCAYDMALISQEALKNEEFRKVTGTKVAHLDATNKYEARTLGNHHNMLNAYTTSQYLYPDCIGGKTGFTSAAQSTLVTFAKRGDTTLICVVMQGASAKISLTKNIYTDTTSLLNFGFENYQSHSLSEKQTSSDQVETPFFSTFGTLMDNETSPLTTSSSSKILLPNGVKASKAKQKVVFYEGKDNAPEKNQIGTVTYTYGNKTVGNTNIYFDSSALKDTLISDDDISYTKRTYIAARSQANNMLIRRIAIVISIVVVVIILALYIHHLFSKRHKAKKRYRRSM